MLIAVLDPDEEAPGQENRHKGGVQQRLTVIGFNQPIIMNHPQYGAGVNQAMKGAPALAAQAANHACGGCQGQRYQQDKRGKPYGYEAALEHVLPHFRPVEKFIESNPGGE